MRGLRYAVSLLAALALLVVPAVASAAKGFTEQVASARWLILFQCPDGSTAADGRLIVETDNFIEAGTTPDPDPPLRLGFVGQCPDGTFSWGTDAVRRQPHERERQRHVREGGGQPGRRAHGRGRRPLDRDRTDHDLGQWAWL